MPIKATEEQLSKIFNLTNYQFEIPSYQRPYAWGEDQVLDLIDDLIDAFAHPSEIDYSDYFFGSIILIKDNGQPKAQVIDGQQRLTTLTILLSIFRHLLPDGHRTITRISELLENEDFEGNKLYGLKLRSQDNEFFHEYIRTVRGVGKLLDKDTGLATDSQVLLKNNTQTIIDKLTNSCPPNLDLSSWALHLCQNLLAKCYLVVVSTSDFETAYRIFSTINSRGLDLKLNDILKAEIIGKIDTIEDKAKYTKIWEGEERDLGREDFEALFSHIHRIKIKEKPQKGLLSEYRHRLELQPQNNPIEFIDQTLKPCSDALEIIRDQGLICDNEKDKQEINHLFGWLNLIDNSDWLPPAIYFLVKYGDKASQIKDFYLNLERLAAGLMILRIDVNKRIKRYKKVLEAIESSAEEAITVSKQLLSPSEQNQIIEVLDGNLYEQSRSRLYVLKRLDSALADSGLSPSFDAKLVTIEHVLPQTPKEGSHWCQIWDREKWVHKLGNLVLLSRRKNSSAGNLDFAEKKEKYFQQGNPTIFPITIKTLDENIKEWNQEIVAQKQTEYLQKLIDIWHLEKSTDLEVDKETIHKEFWTQLLKRINFQSDLFQKIQPRTRKYIGTTSKIISGVSFQFTISNTYCCAEIYIKRENKEENKLIFEQLLTEKEEIENSFGSSLKWDSMEGRLASRIKAEIKANVYEQKQWESILLSMVENMLQLIVAFKLPLQKVKKQLEIRKNQQVQPSNVVDNNEQKIDKVELQLTKACETVYGEPIKLISWQLEDNQENFELVFRECRRGWYFNMLLIKKSNGQYSSSNRVLPAFLSALQPEETLWHETTQQASEEDWQALDQIVQYAHLLPETKLLLADQNLIGEEVADEAMERFDLYVPDDELLPVFIFENNPINLRLISYFKHPDKFAGENMIQDNNTQDCEVYSSLTEAEFRLRQKIIYYTQEA